MHLIHETFNCDLTVLCNININYERLRLKVILCYLGGKHFFLQIINSYSWYNLYILMWFTWNILNCILYLNIDLVKSKLTTIKIDVCLKKPKKWQSKHQENFSLSYYFKELKYWNSFFMSEFLYLRIKMELKNKTKTYFLKFFWIGPLIQHSL